MTQKRKITFATLAVCAVACAAVGIVSGCSGEKEWDVSADASDSVKARLVPVQDGFTLNITGQGGIKDWNSADEVPWKNEADKIVEINISPNINKIGSYCFYGIENAGPVVLPSGVKSAGASFISENTAIFTFGNDIEFADNVSDCVYTYREEDITTNDRYWQSDKSSGNIISNADDLSADSGKYWRYNSEDIPVKYEKTKVLFIGNSFTYRNGVVEHSSGVPGIFDNIAEDLGYCTETYSVTGPGWYLDSHAKPTDTCGKQVDMLLKACDDFDYIVLQDQSQVAYKDYARFKNGITALKNKIEETQKHAEIYLYETWGSPFSANEDKTSVPEMERKLRDAYTKAGNELGLNVSYIGKAFTYIYNNYPSIKDTKISGLYASDNRHQGYSGAYLSACVHVGNMLGGDVRNTKFEGEEKYSAPELGEEDLTALRNTAYNVVFGEIDDSDVTVTPPEQSGDEEQREILKVACWGRFMKEEKFNELIADFKNYCTENKIEYKEITGVYYNGATNSAPYYYIADFAAKVVADKNADIVLPCADNFNANQSSLAAVELVAIDVYGQNNRRVAALNDDDLTKTFLIYVKTDRAKAIFEKQD